MMRALPGLILLFSLTFSGCSDPPPEPEKETASHPPVGVLKSNGYEVTLHTAPDGTRYTLKVEGGALLASQMTGEEFATRYPEIHDEIRGLWAGNEISRPVRIETHGEATKPFTFDSIEAAPVDLSPGKLPSVPKQ